jgi:ornithine cyclodeaminase
MQIIPLDAMRAVYDRDRILQATRTALIRHAAGDVVSPMPGQLLFSQPPGDCHIKYGRISGDPYFVIKIATGFYDNPSLGLPSFNGLMLVMDAHTGFPLALLQDEGWLTSWRTVAAGTLASLALAPPSCSQIGIFGTGQQAQLHAEWLTALTGIQDVMIYGRSNTHARQLAHSLKSDTLRAHVAETPSELLQSCQLIVTATASTEPLFSADQVQPGTHITALGADSPGKQELDAALFARAAVIATDDHHQCLDHGDFCHAVKAGIVSSDADVPLGNILAGKAAGRQSAHDITIADLTGLAAQDICIASLFYQLVS